VLFRRTVLFVAAFVLPLDFEPLLTRLLETRFELRFFEGFTRSGSLAPPVTSNSANLRRCALLLNGIVRSQPDAVQA
jgi:hypothetical protein